MKLSAALLAIVSSGLAIATPLEDEFREEPLTDCWSFRTMPP